MENKRHTLIVDKRFQFHHMLEVLLLTFIAINLVVIIVFVFFTGTIEAEANLTLGVSIAVIEIAALIGILWIARRSSNRIAGPVYRICRTLDAVAQGDLTARVSLRERDHFAEQADIINAALDRLSDRIVSAQRLAEQLQVAPGDESAEQLRSKLREFCTEFHPSQTPPSGVETAAEPAKSPSGNRIDSGFTLVELMIVLLVISILALIAIPLYQNYTIRTQISEGFLVADPVKRALMEEYLETGDFPTDNEEAAVGPSTDYQTTYIQEILVEPDGVIRIIYAIAALTPRTHLLLYPRVDDPGSVGWDCNDDSYPFAVPIRYRPNVCRQ